MRGLSSPCTPPAREAAGVEGGTPEMLHAPHCALHSFFRSLAHLFIHRLRKVPPPHTTLLGVRASTCDSGDMNIQSTAAGWDSNATVPPPGHSTSISGPRHISGDNHRARPTGDACHCWRVGERLTLPATPPRIRAPPLRKVSLTREYGIPAGLQGCPLMS